MQHATIAMVVPVTLGTFGTYLGLSDAVTLGTFGLTYLGLSDAVTLAESPIFWSAGMPVAYDHSNLLPAQNYLL